MSAASRPLVAVVMGSKSDWGVMSQAAKVLEEFAVAHECRVLSAHRTPVATAEYVGGAEGRGLKALELLRGAGIDIRNFELVRPTLEEIFLSVVRGGRRES